MSLSRRLFVLLLLLAPVSLFAQETPKPPPPADAKKNLLKLLDRPKVPADVRVVTPAVEADGLVTEHYQFASERKADGVVERVPVLLVRPVKAGKYPVIIVLHGTGGNKEMQRDWLKEYASRGIIGVAIDARYHGERVGGAKGSAAYVEAITRAWRTPKDKPREHPFYYDTVWDLWRLVDQLETRADVDAKHIGMLGISMGGIQTWLAASVDDRVAVAAPLIGVQSFQWSLENGQWQGRAKTIAGAHEAAARDLGEPEVNARVCKNLWGTVIPGILDQFDCPNLLPLFAGRALFIANGARDPNCPVEGAKIAIARAEEAFAKSGSPEKLKVIIEDVAHTVTANARKQAIEWTSRWLKS